MRRCRAAALDPLEPGAVMADPGYASHLPGRPRRVGAGWQNVRAPGTELKGGSPLRRTRRHHWQGDAAPRRWRRPKVGFMLFGGPRSPRRSSPFQPRWLVLASHVGGSPAFHVTDISCLCRDRSPLDAGRESSALSRGSCRPTCRACSAPAGPAPGACRLASGHPLNSTRRDYPAPPLGSAVLAQPGCTLRRRAAWGRICRAVAIISLSGFPAQFCPVRLRLAVLAAEGFQWRRCFRVASMETLAINETVLEQYPQ